MQITFMWKDEGSHVGDCPAIYEAPGGYVIQGKLLDDETRAQLRDLGGDETAVFVPANVIDRIKGLSHGPAHRPGRVRRPAAHLPAIGVPAGDPRRYALGYERADFERFLAGPPTPPPQLDWWQPWLEQIARLTRDGKHIARVRVLAEPPTAYQRWEIWAAPWHAQAGEDIRYLPRRSRAGRAAA